jgi:hypothetical protein
VRTRTIVTTRDVAAAAGRADGAGSGCFWPGHGEDALADPAASKVRQLGLAEPTPYALTLRREQRVLPTCLHHRALRTDALGRRDAQAAILTAFAVGMEE